MTRLSPENSRVDLDIYNEATSFFISNGDVKGKIECTPSGLALASAAKQLIVNELDQDDGFIARVVLGELNEQEQEEWIACGRRLLNLPRGRLVVSGGNAYVSKDCSPEEIDNDEGEFFEIVEVPQGEYLVTVYTQLPSVNGFRLTRFEQWEGFIPYFRKTRPQQEIPDWLMEFAEIDGEELDGEYEEEQEYIWFVIQLQKAKPGASQSELNRGYLLIPEYRMPERCPLGMEPVGIEREGTAVDEEEDAKQEYAQRFDDPDDLAARFQPFAEAIHAGKFAEAADFFVPQLRDRAAKYLQESIAELSESLHPVNDVWMDRKSVEVAIKCWKNGEQEWNNFVDISLMNKETWVGDIRCEFGNSDDYIAGKIDLHVIVDSAVIATADGPQIVGTVFLS